MVFKSVQVFIRILKLLYIALIVKKCVPGFENSKKDWTVLLDYAAGTTYNIGMISIIKRFFPESSFKHVKEGQAGCFNFSRNSTWSAWFQAARMPSQVYIFLPLLMGQAMAFTQGAFSWSVFLFCHLYGLAMQLFIVFANDVADEDTDRLNSTYTIFSGGSRVLADDCLSSRSLFSAAGVSALLCLLAGVLLAWFSSGWGPLLLVLLGLVLLWAYSFKPFRLSYRGGGELLQMLGVGGVLPMLGYLAQHGSLSGIYWPYMGLMLLLALSCAMSTSLPDEPSDRLSLKKSSSVLLGGRLNQRLILALNAGAFFLLALFMLHGLGYTGMYLIALLCLGLWFSGVLLLDQKPGSLGLSVFVASSVSFSLLPMAGVSMALFIS